jgi:hypothetical protein
MSSRDFRVLPAERVAGLESMLVRVDNGWPSSSTVIAVLKAKLQAPTHEDERDKTIESMSLSGKHT